MKKMFVFILLYSISIITFASQWPVFYIPDANYLLSQQILTSTGCPQGMLKFNNITTITVGNLCQTYCPSEWTWNVSANDQNCFTADSFKLLNTDFKHVNDSNGTTLYSIVTATFGDFMTNTPELTLTFTTPQENWFCIMQNKQLNAVTCANDT